VSKEEDTYYVPGISDRWMSKAIIKRAVPPDLPVLGLLNLTELTEPFKEKEIPPMANPKETTTTEVALPVNSESPSRPKSAATIAKEQKRARYNDQEQKRASRIQVDQTSVMAGWIVIISIAFLSSAVISFNGITAVSAYVGLSAEWMRYLFFFFVELMYLLFLVAYLILSSRIDETTGKPENTFGVQLWMWIFAGIAIASNGFHTLDYWKFAFTEPRLWAGFVLSVAAPIAIIMASKLASRVVFAKAVVI